MAQKPKPTHYEKIMSREDGRRPLKVSELIALYGHMPDALVMKCNLVTPEGSIRYTWSETLANQAAAREKLRGDSAPAPETRRRVGRRDRP